MTLTESTRGALEVRYRKAALDYLHGLPLEHFMESTPHAKQREITLESLALVKAKRSDVHVFNELLVQYPLPRRKKLGQVVPDNMVVVHPYPIDAEWSFNYPLTAARPLWILEYVSKGSKRKDYIDNMRHYERAMKVPYYLLFDPRTQTLTLHHHNGKKYVAVKANADGRLGLPELHLEMAILDGWVRFWYQGKLLPLPADLQKALDGAEKEIAEVTRRAERAETEAAELRMEIEKLRSKKNGSR